MSVRQILAATVTLLNTTLLLAFPSLAIAADTYRVDPVHSSVIFRVKHFGVGYFYGRFNEASGAFVVDAANPSMSSVEVQVKADTVDTHNPKRDQHLKSPDFFNAKQFPVIWLCCLRTP